MSTNIIYIGDYMAKGLVSKKDKLDILINDYTKLEKSNKDYICKLTKKLADIQTDNKFQQDAGETVQDDQEKGFSKTQEGGFYE